MLRALFPQRCFAEWGCTADPSAYLEDVVVQCELKVRRLHARFGQQPWDNADQKRLYRVLLSTPTARLLTLRSPALSAPQDGASAKSCWTFVADLAPEASAERARCVIQFATPILVFPRRAPSCSDCEHASYARYIGQHMCISALLYARVVRTAARVH